MDRKDPYISLCEASYQTTSVQQHSGYTILSTLRTSVTTECLLDIQCLIAFRPHQSMILTYNTSKGQENQRSESACVCGPLDSQCRSTLVTAFRRHCLQWRRRTRDPYQPELSVFLWKRGRYKTDPRSVRSIVDRKKHVSMVLNSLTGLCTAPHKPAPYNPVINSDKPVGWRDQRWSTRLIMLLIRHVLRSAIQYLSLICDDSWHYFRRRRRNTTCVNRRP